MHEHQVLKNLTRGITSPQEPFIWRPRWFLNTRYISVLVVAAAIASAEKLFLIDTFNYPALWLLTGILLFSNIIYVLVYRSGYLDRGSDNSSGTKRLVGFTKVQINNDLLILSLMIHFSGGATNPFIFYYFFHTILSSILLSKRAAYTEAFLAASMFSAITVLEGLKIIPHYDLYCPNHYSQNIFMIGMIVSLSSALFIAVYMATSIMDRLRLHRLELESALEELRRLETEKSRFMDVVAHDLKSPIASIETMVTVLLTVHGDTIAPKVKEILERIPRRTKDLIRFIRELLEFSRIRKLDQTRVRFKELNFLPIVTGTIEIHMVQATEKNISVSVRADKDLPDIMGNADHLERLAANLISNAILYTPENGSVDISLVSEGDEIVFTVSDTGIGIPEKALPHIFTDFYRAANARKFTSSGTGLGMSITKAIAEMHGGTVTVSSREGEGSTFTVRLPVLTGDTAPSGAPE